MWIKINKKLKRNQKENKFFKKGFTLLEVIVAVFILTVGVGGSFALIQQTLFAAAMAQSRIIAAYLAQEGIEIIRNIRDNNWLEQRESSEVLWNDGLNNCLPPNSCCEADYETDTPSSYPPLTTIAGCTFNDLRYLNIDNSGFYSYSGDNQTKFKRRIFIELIDTDKIKVEVVVEWKERGRTHQIEVVEHITNWYEKHKQ
ncbi:MAG: type IV pilus modification PilV family protein [Candidatus Nealsonbacteria bacterium]